MRRFICYRQMPPESYFTTGAANPPDEPQFEGVVFSDGTTVLRWLTEFRSHSVWASFEDMMAIHGHPEYGTVIKWIDPEGEDDMLESAWNIIANAGWDGQGKSPGWQEAAVRWRDNYHEVR